MAERTKLPIAKLLDDCARLDKESEKGWAESEIAVLKINKICSETK